MSELRGIVRRLKSATIAVGVLKNAPAYSDGTSLAEVAAKNEYGSGNVPMRPFLRPTIRRNKKAYSKAISAAVKKSIKSKRYNGTKGMLSVGKMAATDVQKTIARGGHGDPAGHSGPVPNAASTQAAKGNDGGINGAGMIDQPLIDTGHMIDNIRSELR